MNLKKTLLSVLMILQLCLLVGCDYIEKASKVDDLVTQQELQKRGRLREGAESYAKALASDILR